MPTKIEWTNETWNPVTGCTPVSEGCRHCYARRMARRLAGRCGYPEAPHHFDVTLHPERLDQPLRWRKPRMIFVCSMSDLFHKDVPPSFICEIWQVMRECPQHTFQILTKRAQRMFEIITTYIANDALGFEPLPNAWGLVTAENQAAADERIPWLRKTPFAVRGVSVEPCLSAIDLTPWLRERGGGCFPIGLPHQQPRLPANWHQPRLDWVICGGESGPGARPMHPDCARLLRDQCQAAGVPFFFKQWGEYLGIDYMGRKAGSMPVWTRADGLHKSLGKKPEINFGDGHGAIRIGKKRAGHLLDGREHHEFPRISVDSMPAP